MNEPKLITLCQQHTESLEKAHEKLDSILVVLRGDDSGEKPGLVQRMGVVEKFNGAVKRILWIVVSTGVSTLVLIALYWAFFRIKPPM
jgi:hypothetical protein